MNKMEVVKNNVKCPMTIVEYNKSIIDQIIFLENAKKTLQEKQDSGEEITMSDVLEVLGFEK